MRSKQIEKFRVAVLTISDRCSRGQCKDESGPVITKKIRNIGAEILNCDVVADEVDAIKERLIYYCDELRVDFVFTTGGTGLGSRDVTPEATMAVSEKMVPGISELIRQEGIKKTKNAALSRAVSVIRKNTLIINFPGSPKAVKESLTTVLDIIPHAFDMLRDLGHR